MSEVEREDNEAEAKAKYNSKKALLHSDGTIEEITRKEAAKLRKHRPNDVFDSKLEARYYRDELLPDIKSGFITVEQQVKFVLVPKQLLPNGKVRHLPITYTADFLVTYPDGRTEVLDVKGADNEKFPLKWKMFDHKFSEMYGPLRVMKHNAALGGWMEYDEWESKMKVRRKELKEQRAKRAAEKEAKEAKRAAKGR